MFRILFAPKATPNRNEITVLDLVYGKFNTFTIDLENRELKVWMSPNTDRGIRSYEEMELYVREEWDTKKLEYRFEGAIAHIKIPEGHEVITQIK